VEKNPTKETRHPHSRPGEENSLTVSDGALGRQVGQSRYNDPMRELAQTIKKMIGVDLKPNHMDAFAVYERELHDWNQRVSLTAIRDPEKIRVKHFLDSLTCFQVMQNTPMERVVDVGTGGGFPGLPLKIVYPTMHLTLVDSVGKKLDFCRHLAGVLALENVDFVQRRAETLGQDPNLRETYDWALARAVAVLPVLAEYLLPLVRVGGKMLAMKGESGPAEAHGAENALRMLGGHLRRLVKITLPGVADERYLIVVDKVAATPQKYPRRTGIPSKRPL
jgi:16S rRNA (guanine527-N7)-methyltransferase